MEKNKVDSFAEFKLNQKIVDITKKIVNRVAIASYILGLIFGVLSTLPLLNIYQRGNVISSSLPLILIYSVFFSILLYIVNRGLNKYKEVE